MSIFLDKVVDTLFPRFCVSCNREGILWCKPCDATWSSVPLIAQCPFCHRKGSDRPCSDCRNEVYLDGIRSFASYGNPVVRKALSVWKYDQDRAIEKVLFSWLTRAAVRMEPPLAPFYACPVPLHMRKQHQRGFDQAKVVAGWAGEIYGIPVETVLRRRYYNASQASASSGDRSVGELDDLFEILPGSVVPENILLCDDVFTSGATMDAAARILKEAGAKQVWGWVIAKGK